MNMVDESFELYKLLDDRKARLEKSRLQRDVDFRHFEGDTDVSGFVS